MIKRRSLPALLLMASEQSRPFSSLNLRLIVPSAPGGTGDLLPRLFAPLLSRHIGCPVIVENRPGAGGRVGALYVAQARGKTIVCAANVSSFAVYPALARHPLYDPLRHFTLVSTLADTPNVLCVGSSARIQDLSSLIRISRGDEVSYASPGVGSLGHFMGLLFNRTTGSRLRHVPYRGAGPALQDVIAGHVPVLFDNLPAALPHIRDGRLRPLLVASPARVPAIPQVPTFDEAGMPDLNHPAWFGLVGPQELPSTMAAALEESVRRAHQDASIGQALRELGALPAPPGPEALRLRLTQALERYGRVGRQAGISLED